MPYSFDDLKRLGIRPIEKPESEVDTNLSEGKVIKDLPARIKTLLIDTSGGKYEDQSRQDSSVISSLLASGLSIPDTYSTFAASPRGRSAAQRKQGHLHDYLSRTISKAASYLSSKNGNGNDQSVSVDFGRKSKTTVEDGIVEQLASGVEIEKVRWVWPSYIPAGKITILSGDPGMGKSTIAIDIVARVTRGAFLPVGEGRTITGNCVIASAEDAAGDTIVPRLIASKAVLSRVSIVRKVQVDDEMRYLSFPRDMERLYKLIERGVRVCVIDPLNAFLDHGVDSHKDQDIRSALAPLEDLAEETGVAIIIVSHLNKKEDTASALYRVGGSIGLTGAARSVLMVSTAQNGSRVLHSEKENLSKKAPALAYDIKQVRQHKKNSKEGWLGEDSIRSSMIRWIGPVDFDKSKKTMNDLSQAEEEVRSFLERILLDSEVPTDDIFSEAKKAGISKGQLLGLRISLGIRSEKRRDGRWYWKWPSGSDV